MFLPASFFGAGAPIGALSAGPVGPISLSDASATLTSAAGAPPEVDLTFGSDIYVGFYLRIQRTDVGAGAAGDYTTPTLDIIHQITEEELSAGAIANADLADDGYTDPTGYYWQRYRWENDGGQVGPWSEINGSVTASVAVLATVTGVDKSQYVDVTGTPKLTFTGNANLQSRSGVRSTTAPVNDKFHFEVTVNAFRTASGTEGGIYVGVCDDTSALGPGTSADIGKTVPGAALRFSPVAGAAVFANGVQSSSVGTATQVGDIIVVEVDQTANQIVWKRRRAGADTVMTTITMTSQIPANYRPFVAAYRDIDSGTCNFGASAFASAPSTGYDIYG